METNYHQLIAKICNRSPIPLLLNLMLKNADQVQTHYYKSLSWKIEVKSKPIVNYPETKKRSQHISQRKWTQSLNFPQTKWTQSQNQLWGQNVKFCEGTRYFAPAVKFIIEKVH